MRTEFVRPVIIAALIVAPVVATILTNGDSAESPAIVDDPQRKLLAAVEHKEPSLRSSNLPDVQIIQSAGPEAIDRAVEAGSTVVAEVTDLMPNRLFSNVGDYIDPDDVPATTGERVNIGDYIDPDELPEYANAEVNIGAYIDPEELPEGPDVNVNFGEYMDPEVLTTTPSQGVNVGSFLPPP